MKRVVLLSLFFLIGCSPPVTDGRLLEKRYRAAYTSYVPVSHRVGKSSFSTIVPVHHPERFEALVYVERDRHGYEEWVDVDGATYAKLQLGWELHSGCWSEPPMRPLTLETK